MSNSSVSKVNDYGLDDDVSFPDRGKDLVVLNDLLISVSIAIQRTSELNIIYSLCPHLLYFYIF
jgi:hypothetical protein